MRILIVHNYYKIPGGEDTVVKNESILLKENDNEVFLYERNNNELESYSLLEKLLLPFKIIFSFKTFKDIRKMLEENNIDIVHVHNTVCVISPSVYYAAFTKKIPIVQTIHNFRLICPGASLLRDGQICDECVKKNLFHSAKYNCYRQSKLNTLAVAAMESIHKRIGTYKRLNYICLTDFNKKQLLRINNKGSFINPNKVYIKPNFVAREMNFIPFEKRSNQVVYAGRLDPTKGIRVLYESWKNITKYNLIVCGIGPEEEWCRQYIRNNKIENIHMLGFVPNEKTIDIIANSKALILPTQWYEGFPMVLVESFACGTPVLGSRIGNVGSIIQEGVNGYLFDQKSPEDIVRAVNCLSDICDKTLEYSNRYYSKESNYKMLMEIYNKCIEPES